MKNKTFPTKSFVLAAFLMAVTFVLNISNTLGLPAIIYVLIMGYALLSIVLHKNLSKSNRENPKRFVSSFMGAVGIKLFASLIFLVLYLFIVRDDTRIPVTISLFIVYMAYTILLIRQLTGEIRETEELKST